jgi:hypothetical protein
MMHDRKGVGVMVSKAAAAAATLRCRLRTHGRANAPHQVCHIARSLDFGRDGREFAQECNGGRNLAITKALPRTIFSASVGEFDIIEGAERVKLCAAWPVGLVTKAI